MRITVLGKSPSWSDAGGACSGYLVQEGDFTLLLDCGNGVFAKLREHTDYAAVDAVLITHLHADHFLDLVPFSYGLAYGPSEGGARPALHVPRGAGATFRRVVGAWGDEHLIEQAFALAEYDPAAGLRAGPLGVRLCPVPHFVPTCAVEFSAAAGRRFTFGADCAPNEQIVEFARDTDLLLLEATLPRPEADPPRGHLTPHEAGEHAARAAARRFVITHFSDELDQGWVRAEAERGFGGPVEVAAAGAVYEL